MSDLRLRSARGFSMIELLIVMVVMGILAAIAIPMYLHQRERARDANAREGARTIAIATQMYIIEGDEGQGAPPAADKATLTPTYLEVKDWPKNMHADGRDMQIGVADGDYDYEVIDSPKHFKLTVHLVTADDFMVP